MAHCDGSGLDTELGEPAKSMRKRLYQGHCGNTARQAHHMLLRAIVASLAHSASSSQISKGGRKTIRCL